MPSPDGTLLSRRERQIMDSLYRRGEATVAQIQTDLPEAPTDSAIRAMLRLLVAKGEVARSGTGRPQVYRPLLPHDEAGKGAVRHLIRTFFQGSRERAVQAILSASETRVSSEELGRLEALIATERARASGRPLRRPTGKSRDR